MVNSHVLPPEALPVIKDTNYEREMKNQEIWMHGFTEGQKKKDEQIISITSHAYSSSVIARLHGISNKGRLFYFSDSSQAWILVADSKLIAKDPEEED